MRSRVQQSLQMLVKNLKAREILRFNWLLLFLVWALLAVPIVLPWRDPIFVAQAMTIVYFCLVAAWIFVVFHAAQLMTWVKYCSTTVQKIDPQVRQLIFISLYKEPCGIIEQTLASLANQTIAQHLIIVLGFESKTPDLNEKISTLRNRYQEFFGELLFTVHPYGLPDEVAGKCSNVNYSVREILRQLDLSAREIDATLVTTCDADNLFQPHHFAELERAFHREKDPYSCVWQAPLFYDWDPQHSSVLARVTGLTRSIQMLGVLLPLQINTMSVQSVSLRLLIRGNFYHPQYQMDDILNIPRWMTELRGPVTIRSLNFPILSGPTSGHTLQEEFDEWRRQARRWSIGAAEVFHYFVARLFQLPMGIALRWSIRFVGYYYFYQLAGPILLLAGALLTLLRPDIANTTVFGLHFSTWSLMIMLAQIAMVGAMHTMQIIWTRAMGIGQPAHAANKILDIFLTPLVMLAYSIVSLAALHELAVRGKAVCGHDPSAKNKLATIHPAVTLFDSGTP